MQTIQPKWFFKLGSALIAFPLTNGNVEENRKLLIPQFPQLRFTSVFAEDAELVNGNMQVNIVLPPVKTNG